MNRTILAKALALSFSLFLICGAELALRRLPLPAPRDNADKNLQDITSILRRDDDLFWVQRSHLRRTFFGAEIATDEFGLRNPEGHIASRGSADEFRILVLGASPSFGWGVPEEFAYPRRLEAILNARSSRPVKVINASVIGYSSWQGLALLKKHLAVFRPDHIIASYAINDVSRERFFYSGAQPDKDLRIRGSGFWNILNDLALARAAAALAARLRPPKVPAADWPIRVSPQDFAKNHAALIALARQNHAGISFLIIPFRFPQPTRLDARAREMTAVMDRAPAYFDMLRKVAREGSVEVIDTTAPLLARYSDYYLVGQGDYIHPNVRGHGVIAERIARQMLPRLTARPGPGFQRP